MNVLTLMVDINSNEPVLQLATANDDHILQRVRLTPEHPVYVLNRNGQELGWTITADLAPGDLIADIDGGTAVKVVSNTLTQTQETVYNFEVDKAHNYFADELGLWVHNGRGGAFRKIFEDPKTPKWIKGWIKNDLRRIKNKVGGRGERFSCVRTPPGHDLGHPLGRPRRLGFGHGPDSRIETITDNRRRGGKSGF